MLGISLLFFFLILSYSSCDNCYSCMPPNDICITCDQGFYLNNGSCFRPSISNGAVAGIVIGCLVIGSLVVIAMLCLIVWCSETVQQREQIVETVSADTYYLTSNHYGITISASTSAIMTPNMNQKYVNNSLRHNFPIADLQNISIQPEINLKQISNFNTRNHHDCTICLHKNTNIKLLPCGHTFHFQCVMAWTNKYNFCPNCNTNFLNILIACHQCGNFNQNVFFCTTRCQHSNPQQCFLKRNKDKLICRNCLISARTLSYRMTIKQ